MKNFNQKLTLVIALIVSLGLGLNGLATARASTVPSLASIETFGVVSSTFTNTNTSPQTIINGDVCFTTGSATVPLTVTGAYGACSGDAGADQLAALADVNGQACTSIGAAVALNAITIPGYTTGTFPPGCYSSTGAMTITLGTTVTLDGAGAYIFKSAGALTTGANSFVTLVNGANAADVTWAPVGATSIGAFTTGGIPPTVPTFIGNILDAAGITLGHFAYLSGRALAFGGTVTTDANTITVPPTPGSLYVIKNVVNTGGGTATSTDFSMTVKLAGVNVAGSPAVGTTTPGTLYSLTAGTYVVSETNNPSYSRTFSASCPGGSVTLTAGASVTCTVTNTYSATPVSDPDIVTATAASGGGSFAPLPLINVSKVPSPLALPSGPGLVTYTYTATNIGPVGMYGVWVSDDKCSPVTLVSGDSDKDLVLDINEAWIYTCKKIVSLTETNTATAHGQANGWDAYDTANATVAVSVSLPPPLIHLVKRPSVFVLPVGGGAVTYFYTVTNPGTAPLSNVSVTDDKCTGLPGRVVGHPGDLNKNNLLESNEIWQFTCQTVLSQTTTNIGTAEGHANGLTAVDFSPATVVVAGPSFPNTGLSD